MHYIWESQTLLTNTGEWFMLTLNSGTLLKNNERWGDDIDNRYQEGQVVWSEEKLRKIKNIEADDLSQLNQGGASKTLLYINTLY